MIQPFPLLLPVRSIRIFPQLIAQAGRKTIERNFQLGGEPDTAFLWHYRRNRLPEFLPDGSETVVIFERFEDQLDHGAEARGFWNSYNQHLRSPRITPQ